MPIPHGKSLELVVKELLEKWEGERVGYLNLRSPILFLTLLELSHRVRGILPRIAERPAALQTFAYYPSSHRTIQICDARGVILGYRFKIPAHLLITLNNTSKTLGSYDPPEPSGGGDPLAEGFYTSRSYAVWADNKKYVESEELLRDGDKGREWLRENQELFDYCSIQLRLLYPEQYVRMTGPIVKDMAKTRTADGRKLMPLGGAWHGVCLNQGLDPGQSRSHQDRMNDKRLFNCVVPFGDGFRDGELVLWQMKMRIGLEIGDGFFFHGSLVAHEVMEVTAGVRNSIDLFTRASNYEFLEAHKRAAGKVIYPAKVKVRGTAGRGGSRVAHEGVVARRQIWREKKQRQRAAGQMRTGGPFLDLSHPGWEPKAYLRLSSGTGCTGDSAADN
ncbi:unnamed protein product [Tuber aestivum]|uniref:Uncharacterized protein n=1 Tax=Tuber aestivum TaxID=59557 RepID=A0A292Q490_9PEZI|nr:unnamed protein product [Tuber aestivum]